MTDEELPPSQNIRKASYAQDDCVFKSKFLDDYLTSNISGYGSSATRKKVGTNKGKTEAEMQKVYQSKIHHKSEFPDIYSDQIGYVPYEPWRLENPEGKHIYGKITPVSLHNLKDKIKIPLINQVYEKHYGRSQSLTATGDLKPGFAVGKKTGILNVAPNFCDARQFAKS